MLSNAKLHLPLTAFCVTAGGQTVFVGLALCLQIPAGSAPRQLHRFLNLAKGSGAQPHSARVTALPSEMLPGPHEGGGGSATSYEANKELLLLRGYLHHHGHDEKQ